MERTDFMEKKRTFLCSSATIKEVREWIADLLLKRDAPPKFVNDVVLAASEAVTNSVVHSYETTHEGPVDVRLLICGNAVHLKIRDYGAGLAIKNYQPPDLDTPHEGGYGLFLIHRLMDSVTVKPLDRGTEIHMIKQLP
jgi:serine/threonine-protein kinase RsbW